MYDRAPRVLAGTAPLTRTSSSVGPGCYTLPLDPVKAKTLGYAPFLSLSKRESFLTISEEVAVTPAPGHYNVDSTSKGSVKGGKALQNKSRRFLSASSVAPGPGTYTVPSSFENKKNNVKKKTNKKESTDPTVGSTAGANKDKNKTYSSGRITYKRLETAPSIPIPGLNNGYQKDETTGKLEPQFFETQDSTIGPAYYSVKNDPTMVTKKYKGVHFGTLKSQRTDFKGRSGPGPSDYDPVIAPQGTSVTIQSISAKLPRYHELVPQQEEKKGVPGPAKYKLPSQFEQQTVTFEHAIEPPPFGSSQQRFLTSVTYTPPSTKYDDPRTALDALKRVNGMTKSPFGQTAVRFKTDRNAKEIPGPGAYNDVDLTSISNKKQQIAILNPFGTTTVRTAPIIKKDEPYLPGPAQYQPSLYVTAPNQGETNSKPSSMFSSTSKRLYSPPSIITTIPPPGSYDVQESFSKTQGKFDVQSDTQYSAFLSSNSRFAPPRDIALNETDSINPGPGEYECQEHQKVGLDNNGLICSRDTRFKNTPKTALGPGAYRLSKQQQHTLLKGTHNITLNNPLRQQEETGELKKKHGHVSSPETKRQIIVLNV